MVKPKKPATKPKVTAVKAVKPTAVAPVVVAVQKAVTVPVFANVKELRQWVSEQNKAKETYDLDSVQKQLAQLLQPKGV